MSERIRSEPAVPVVPEAAPELAPKPVDSLPTEVLDSRLQLFTEQARMFSRDFVDVAGPVFTRDSVRAATVNVLVAKSLFGKWSIEILLMLYGYRELGFQELRRNLKGISPRVLSQKLRLLEERGLVERTVLPTRPTRVRYTLTDDGLTLAKLGEPVFIFLRYRQNRAPGRRRSRSTTHMPAVEAAVEVAVP